MTDDIDEAASRLSEVRSGEGFDSVPVTDVTEQDHELVVSLRLPDGTETTDRFTIPPVWAANCELTRLLSAVDVPPDDLEALIGTSLPCERSVTAEGIECTIDVDALVDRS